MFKMLFFGFCLLFRTIGIFAENLCYVTSPVLDVRTSPLAKASSFKPTYPMLSKYSGGLDTQLLYGDHVILLDNESNSNWAYVETMQKVFSTTKQEVINCRGWVLKKGLGFAQEYNHTATIIKKWAAIKEKPDRESASLYTFSYGTQLDAREDSENKGWCPIKLLDGSFGYLEKKDLLFHHDAKEYSKEHQRGFIRATIELFKADPYVWGGVSAHDPSQLEQTTGNDCSGLIYLIFNKALFYENFPRNSSSQYKLSNEQLKSGRDMQPGDLLFCAKKTDSGELKVYHVMVYLGGGDIAESTGLGYSDLPKNPEEVKKLCVTITSVQDRFGVTIEDMISGEPCVPGDNRYVLMGRYVNLTRACSTVV